MGGDNVVAPLLLDGCQNGGRGNAGTDAGAGAGLAAALVLFHLVVDHSGFLTAAQPARSALVTVLAVHVAAERKVTGERRFRRLARHGPPEEALNRSDQSL